MLQNQSSATINGVAIIPATTVCGNCSVDDRWLIHSVCHRGVLRRLCTSCVLRLHPQSFCPTCFTVYHPSPPPSGPNDGVTCNRCYSVSHSSCVGLTHKHPYICPMCASPNSPIFVPKKVKELSVIGSGGGAENMSVGLNDENDIVIDKNAALILQAASAISCFSMSKAALAAKSVAERRAQEAVYTRKRAKQALEHMSVVVAKEKMRRNEGSRIEVAMPRCGGNVGGVMERKDSYRHESVGNGGGTAAGARSLERNQVMGNLEILERSSNGVLVRDINTVECREKGDSGGIKPHSSIATGPSCSNGATVDVHEHRDVSSDIGDSDIKNHDNGIVYEMSSNPDQLNQSAQRNKVTSNGVVRPPPKEDQFQGVESGHPEKNNNNSLKH